jgi:FkbM family methyltransferase
MRANEVIAALLNLVRVLRIKEFFFLFSLILHYLTYAFLLSYQHVFGSELKLKEYSSSVISSFYRKWTEKEFGVKFVDYENFPIDVFLGDYFQMDDFLPSKGWTVLDVGATCGDWSIIVGKYFGADKVLAIEPSPVAFFSLLKNIRLNNLTEVIIPINVALWDSDAQIPLWDSDAQIPLWDSDAQIRNFTSAFLSVQGSGSSLEVRTLKLDSLICETSLDNLDLLKIDTEGCEARVLKGAIFTIRKFRPKIIVEVHSREAREKVAGLLVSEGYRVVHEKVDSSGSFCSVLYFTTRALRP